jgi:hypothetical protein
MRSGSILPRLEWARSYRRTDLPHDVFAGIVLTAILVPAGMAYAEAAGLPAIVGLYASIVPLLAYAVLGPSRILVLGPDSSLLPIIAAAIIPLAAGDEARATVLGALLAVIVGAVVIAAGLARLGFLTALLSAPVRHGYLNGNSPVTSTGNTSGKGYGGIIETGWAVRYDKEGDLIEEPGVKADRTKFTLWDNVLVGGKVLEAGTYLARAVMDDYASAIVAFEVKASGGPSPARVGPGFQSPRHSGRQSTFGRATSR